MLIEKLLRWTDVLHIESTIKYYYHYNHRGESDSSLHYFKHITHYIGIHDSKNHRKDLSADYLMGLYTIIEDFDERSEICIEASGQQATVVLRM